MNVLVGLDAQSMLLTLIRGAGFQASVCRPENLVETIEAVANSGGRINVVVIGGSYVSLIDKIRAMGDSISFRGTIRARTIPIIVMPTPLELEPQLLDVDVAPGRFAETAIPRWAYFAENVHDIVPMIVRALRDWRQSLLEELEYVGFSVSLDTSGNISLAHALKRGCRESEILAPEATPDSLRAGRYLILAEDVLQQFTIYTELKYLLGNYDKIAAGEKIKPETVFQRFFEQNPHLVKRGLFEQMWAKPKLRIPEESGRYFQPDFVLRPIVAAHVGTNWEILDLKLPDDPLVSSGSFHQAYSAKLTKAMQQLRNYGNYFSRRDREAIEELVSRFGYQPVHPRLAVLIGRRRREAGLDRIQGDAGDLDIDVITYDDIADRELNRLISDADIAGLFS